jgi:hypothetical protein
MHIREENISFVNENDYYVNLTCYRVNILHLEKELDFFLFFHQDGTLKEK